MILKKKLSHHGRSNILKLTKQRKFVFLNSLNNIEFRDSSTRLNASKKDDIRIVIPVVIIDEVQFLGDLDSL